jgi:hypothetical protein
MISFTKIEESILKFIWKHKRTWIAKQSWAETEMLGGIITHAFKLCYRVIVTKTARITNGSCISLLDLP